MCSATSSNIQNARFPVWLKILVSLYVAVLIPVYWVELGVANFLWFCDIAFFIMVVALWRESQLLVSIVAVGVLLPELAWNLDFFGRILTGKHLFGLTGTAYMFTDEKPIAVRVLSLFHVFLPMLTIAMLCKLGYDNRAWLIQSIIIWIVLPLSYWLSKPVANINFAFGLGGEPQNWMPAYLWIAFLMMFFPFCVYLPTHFLLKRFARKVIDN